MLWLLSFLDWQVATEDRAGCGQRRGPKIYQSNENTTFVVPGEGGSAGSCLVLMPRFLWLPFHRQSQLRQGLPNRIGVNVFWGWFASIPSASLLALGML